MHSADPDQTVLFRCSLIRQFSGRFTQCRSHNADPDQTVFSMCSLIWLYTVSHSVYKVCWHHYDKPVCVNFRLIKSDIKGV